MGSEAAGAGMERAGVILAAVDEFSRELDTAGQSQCRGLLVDLTEVGFIESTAIGALAYASVLLKKAQKGLVILAQAGVKELFVTCNLDKTIKIVCTEELVSPTHLLTPEGAVK